MWYHMYINFKFLLNLLYFVLEPKGILGNNSEKYESMKVVKSGDFTERVW